MSNRCVMRWTQATLGQVVRLQRGHDLPSNQRTGGAVPVIGSGGLTGWHNKAKATGPGVVIGRAANLGRPNFILGDYWPLNTTLYVTDFCGNDPRFIFYLFQTMDLTGYNSGSVQPMLNRNYVTGVTVLLPDLPEQQAIAEVLGALDDKIDSNERRAALVTELAVSTYQREAVESERIIPLGVAGKWLSGGTPSTANPVFWGGSIPWISAASLKSFFIATSDRRLTDEGVRSGLRIAPRGSVLFVVRGMSLKSEFRVGIAQRDVAFGQDCKAILAKPDVPPVTLAVALLAARDEILTLVDEAGHGTGRLPTDRLEQLEISLPSFDSAVGLEHALSALVDTGAIAEEGNRRLVRLRDALLPRLLSGELRVRDVEPLVGGAV